MRDPAQLEALTHDITATWLALGLDPARVVLYRQSDVPGVCELAWLLGCVTAKGLLDRGHAYKSAADDNRPAATSPTPPMPPTARRCGRRRASRTRRRHRSPASTVAR